MLKKHIAVIIALGFFIEGDSFGNALDLVSVSNVLYKKGNVKEYEIFYPKSGYYGNPIPEFSSAMQRNPTKNEHYNKRFVRVVVYDKKKNERGLRVVLKIDEIASSGETKIEGIYYAYIEVTNKGIRILKKSSDDRRGFCEGSLLVWSLPFPIKTLRPPFVGIVKNKVDDGYIYMMKYAVFYSLKHYNDSTKEINIEAKQYEIDIPSLIIDEGVIEWNIEKISRILGDTKKSRLLTREVQTWNTPTSWLWEKLERYDSKGNLIVRCNRINIKR